MIIATDATCRKHDAGPGHPEQPRRYDSVREALEKAGWLAKARVIGPRAVVREDLVLVHDAKYVELAEREIREGRDQLSTGDTSVNADSWSAAMAAAGCALAAVDGVMKGEAKTAFCLTRPPGHHATPNRGMGFCVVNNVALAARHAQRRHGIERALIVDWDVHHGNGTQDIFYEDGSVFFFSTHQWPWYPGTGRAEETGRGPRSIVRCRHSAGARRFLSASRKNSCPRWRSFAPNLCWSAQVSIHAKAIRSAISG
jgi:acetoin utilization deacetylase AcuC-like enzyme